MVFGQTGEDLAVEVGVRLPGLRRHDSSVAHGLLWLPGAAGELHFIAHMLVAGDTAVLYQAGRNQHLDAVADGEDPPARSVERPDDLDQPGVVPQVFGRASADNQDGVEFQRGDILKGRGRFQPIAGPLDAGIPAGLEIVHDQMQPLLRRCGDHRLPARLLEPMNGVQRFVTFSGIAGDDKDFLAHGTDPYPI
jgi:hypothetical protein